MNNHWHTNYRADQEGPIVFRYALWPHKRFSAAQSAKFGVERSQPLLARRARPAQPGIPRLRLSSPDVLVSALKPTDDGKGFIVRLFGASGKTAKVKLLWSDPVPHKVWVSDTTERPKRVADAAIEVPGWGLTTLRVE
jgi:alpha-mannosidase